MKFSLALLSLLGSLALCQADTVRLQIKGPDGQPVAGAQVRVVDANARNRGVMTEPFVDLKSNGAGRITLTPTLLGPKSADITKKVFLQARVVATGLAVAVVDLKEGDNTLTLRQGRSVGGVVLDANERPVSGAKVALFQLDVLDPSPFSYPLRGYLQGRQRLEARSDAQGRWRLDNVPQSGVVGFSVGDAGFKSESFLLDVARPVPPFYVERGATVKGRLVRANGKPAGGIEFYAGYSNSPTRTKADGTFQIGGLSDTFYLQIASYMGVQSPFVLPQKRVENLEPGEVRDVGTLKIKDSVHYRGQVVDAVTNKPIAGAGVSAWGNGTNSNGQSDAAGKFDLLIAPEQTSSSVSAQGYISLSLPKVPSVTAPLRNGGINVGVIKLKKGFKVTGKVMTADGRGIAVSINGYKAPGRGAYASSDARGNFTFDGLEAGQYALSVSGHKLKTPVKMTVGGKVTAPLRLMLAEKAKAPGPRKVTGRVMYQGQPVGGAKIRFYFRSHNSWHTGQVAMSSLDGAYTINSPMPDATPGIMGVVRPGYSAQYGEPTIQNGAWNADIALHKLGQVQGRVVDARGNPVPGASVALQTGTDFPVTTDAKGEFTFKDVASTGLTVLASDGPRWKSSLIETEGEVVQLVLPDAVPIADKAALAESIVPNSRLDWEMGKKWQVQRESWGANMVRARALGGSWNWKDMLHMQAERVPEYFLAQEKENREKVPGNSMAEFEALLMLARAGSKDKSAREQVKVWLSGEEKKRREISRGSVSQLLEIAEIAHKLDPAQAVMWTEYAAQLADQIPPSEEDSWQLGQLAAHVSPRAVEMLVEESKPITKLQYLSWAMRTYADRGDLVSARQIFARMQKLTRQVEAFYKTKTPSATAQKTKARRPSTPREVQQARMYIAEGREQLAFILAATDLTAALAQTTQLATYQRPSVLLVIAQNAVKQKKFDMARKAIAEINKTSSGSGQYGAQTAAIALRFDKALAEELFRVAFRKASPKKQENTPWRQIMMGYEDFNSPSVADYAKARAALWPGESRVLIEREWAARQEKTKKKGDNNYVGYTNSQNMKNLVAAMAEVDPQRALEMVALIPNQYGLQGAARGEIALALLRGSGD